VTSGRAASPGPAILFADGIQPTGRKSGAGWTGRPATIGWRSRGHAPSFARQPVGKLPLGNGASCRICSVFSRLHVKYSWFYWGFKEIPFYRTIPFLTLLVSVLVSVCALKIFMADNSSRLNIGGKIRVIFRARVGGMDAERVETAAWMLPDTAPLIPVEAQSPKQTGQTGFASGRNIQPNPFAHNLGNVVLPRQPYPQVVQNRLRGQAAIGQMF
jgi:hypothetical protein